MKKSPKKGLKKPAANKDGSHAYLGGHMDSMGDGFMSHGSIGPRPAMKAGDRRFANASAKGRVLG